MMSLPEIEPAASTPTMLFDGLLTIGTFGSPIFTAAASDEETAGAAAKEIAEKEVDTATENELTTIMVELERLLRPESNKERTAAGYRNSSSSVSARADLAGKCSDACPLQDFLFGSPVEVTATAEERRASLGELFMRSHDGEEAATGGWKRDELNPAAEMSVGAKKMFNDSESAKGGAGGGGGGAGKCRGAEMKFQNIMRMFHRKIHPENSTASKNKLNKKAAKHEIKWPDKHCCAIRLISNSNKNSKSDDGGRSAPEKADERDHQSFKCQEPSELAKNNSKGNGEHWIKTDADYLVLEL